VNAVLQHHAVADKMKPETCPLTLGMHARGRQPDCRHEIASRELGEYPGIDLVRLTSEGREAPYALHLRDLDFPAGERELVVDESGSVHRFDRRFDGSAELRHLTNEVRESICIRRPRSDRAPVARFVKDTNIEAMPAQVKSDVHHGVQASSW
jgi:hypothetical protein